LFLHFLINLNATSDATWTIMHSHHTPRQRLSATMQLHWAQGLF